jgi:hypothetical protein
MKLGMVTHWKCGEPKGRTLVWVPEAMTPEEFGAGVRRAQAAYLAFVLEFKDSPPPNNYGGYGRPEYSEYPEKTVAEVDRIWEAKKKEWEAWNAERQKGYHTFGDYLQTEGMKPVWEVEKGYAYHRELDWGHRHGWPIDRSETEDEDLAGPLKRRGLFDD